MTNIGTTTSQLRRRQQRQILAERRLHKALLKESEVNARIMLRAADLLRELGYDDMALSLFVRSETTRVFIAKATGRDV